MNKLVPHFALASILAGVAALIACQDLAGPTSYVEQGTSPMEIAYPPSPFSFEIVGCSEVVRVEGEALAVRLPDKRSSSGHALEAWRTIAHGQGEGQTSGVMYSYSFQEIFQISWHNPDVTNDEQVSDSFQLREKLIGHGSTPDLHFLSRHHYTYNQNGVPTASINEAEEICR